MFSYILLMACAIFGYSIGIQEVNDESFEPTVFGNTGKFSLVYFYSPSCVHCEAFKANWEPLAALYNETELNLVQIDALTNRKVRSKFNIVAFPTIKMFSSDGRSVAGFGTEAHRSTENLMKFIESHTRIQPKDWNSRVEYLSNLDDYNRLQHEDIVFLFTAPWVKEFENPFNNIFQKTSDEFKEVKFVIVDTSLPDLSELSSTFRIDAIPTVLNKKGSEYQKLLDINEETLRLLVKGDDVGQIPFSIEEDNWNEEEEDEEEGDLAFEEFRKLREL